ncbi:MAG: hypothetical protein ABR978_07735, partial [Dehalococcoidia bacterium]
NVPSDYVVLVDAAGEIPYYSHLRAIDNLGLNDEVIAHTKTANPGSGTAGHERSNAEYVLSRRPDLYVEWHGLSGIAWDEKSWQNPTITQPTRAGLAFLSNPKTFELYMPRSVQVDGRWFNYLRLLETSN